jgi:FtsZ-interacting cell division protein YlmF
MSIFSKKPKNNTYDDNYDNDFYRGHEDDSDVVGEDDDNDLIPPVPAPQKKSVPTSGGWKVVKPHSAQDGLTIADYLVHGYTVVMNIESLDREITMRLIVFLQGAVHVLGGELRHVSTSTFVISPRKGEITDDGDLAGNAESDEYR